MTGPAGSADPVAWLTTGQVARLLERSEGWVRRLATAGALQSVETPLGRLYSPESVAAYQQARTGPGGALRAV
jgi:hypothetical protein